MKTPKPFIRAASLLVALGLLIATSPVLATIEWPQEITAPEGTIVVYQPQPESLAGNVLSGRAAMSLELQEPEELVFGAMWFTAKIDTDRDADIATVRDIKVD